MIKAQVGDKVTVNQKYLENTLKTLAASAEAIATLERLGYCGTDPCVVADTGFLPPPKENICFIRVIPQDPFSMGYHKGQGTALFFDDPEHLNTLFAPEAPPAPAPPPVVAKPVVAVPEPVVATPEAEVTEAETAEVEVVATEEAPPIEEAPTPDDVDDEN